MSQLRKSSSAASQISLFRCHLHSPIRRVAIPRATGGSVAEVGAETPLISSLSYEHSQPDGKRVALFLPFARTEVGLDGPSDVDGLQAADG